ncbi:glycosyltransferase family 4 protein [Aquitalea sp. USM4]|uniref:glycosyltransferase family 4 protein n=1 Tax=Aquitalea sp. USM4 TaxID=1590041 RepID=UPI0010398A35|nr:glycosyltransferase family 4 protein [Aquitalea sp. USM4]QBJ78301.1 glycosyl transferase family 1 [Aquitalea sp. USM4]
MSRLAIVRQKYNPAGGAERIVSAILGQLKQQDELQPVLINRNWEQLDGVAVCRVNPFYLGSIWRDWGFARAARRAWLQVGADLVQSHERIPGCHIFRAGDGVHAAWLAARAEGKGWWHKLSVWCNPYHHFMLSMEKTMFKHPALQVVICNSEMVKQDVLQRFPLRPEQCVVIHNGVDAQRFNPAAARQQRSTLRAQYGIPPAAPVLVYVGSGFERKGVAQALHAIQPHPDVWLVVVGGDKKLAAYRELASQLGIAGRVVFTGPQKDVLSHYGMADGFILPTMYEPFGSVVGEAMACGLPVLTSTRCGGAEWVSPATGWLAAPHDTAAWQRNVAAWLAAQDSWPTMAAQARQRVEGQTEQHMVAQMLALYRSLLSDQHGHASQAVRLA